MDKGSHDIRFTKELVALADRYPDRVTIILGNRDLNKMRLSQELHPTTSPAFPYANTPVCTGARMLRRLSKQLRE